MRFWICSRLLLIAALAAFNLPAAAPPAAAQAPAPSFPAYNAATETTINGTIEAVNQVNGRHGWSGTHVTLKTGSELIDVHLGPSWFLAEKKMALAKGDEIEVIGSRVKYNGAHAIIARQLKKGEQSVALRDAQGKPAWSRGPGRRAAN